MKITQITLDPNPYKHFRLTKGYRVRDLVLISGQAAIAMQGRIVGVGDFDAQVEQACKILDCVLRQWQSFGNLLAQYE